MKLLKEIIRQKRINFQGRTLCREAVRAIVIEKQKLLMVYSAKNGDYKFPGGGIDSGETHLEALSREIREECGAQVSKIGPAFGKIIEYDLPVEREFDVFKMTSFYYLCQVQAVFHEQRLEKYEADLGFRPVWVGVDEAIQVDRSILAVGSNETTRWVERETFVLEQVKEQLIQGNYVKKI